MFDAPTITIRRYAASRICDVVVVVRGQEMVIRCPSYSQAVKWARLECKSYKIPEPDTDFADNEEPGDVPRPGHAKREEERGAEGERGNESGEIARARRNGGAAASARSQASARSAAVRHSAANREISCANSCSEGPGIRAIAQRAKGEGEMTMRALVILTAVCFSTGAYGAAQGRQQAASTGQAERTDVAANSSAGSGALSCGLVTASGQSLGAQYPRRQRNRCPSHRPERSCPIRKNRAGTGRRPFLW